MSENTTELLTNPPEHFDDQHHEEEEEVVQDHTANGDIENVEDATETRNTRAPVLKVDLSAIKGVVISDSASVPQKTDFMEELNNREEEIRKMLYESSTSKQATDRTLPGDRSSIKKTPYEVSRVIRPDSDDEECTFKPKINAKTSKLAASKRQAQEGPVNVNLYKIAQEKKQKAREQEDELRQSISKTVNSNKINPNSVKIILKRIETAIRHLIADSESPATTGKVSFENLGVILHRLGLFQNLEFQAAHNGDDHANKSSVSVNQTKVKPQRLTREVAFHENFWKILAATSEDENLVPSETVFRFLMVLVEDKATVSESAAFLKEVMDVGLEAKGMSKQEGVSIFDQIKEEKQLWEMDKLVSEFRKLFTDKTSFMNIYASSGLLPRQSATEEHTQTTFKPQINAKSKELALKSRTEGYQEKVKAAVQASIQAQTQDQNQSQSLLTTKSRLENRYDILFEHHKLIKDKKHEDSEAKLAQELANCTFKPHITEYKKAKNPNVDASLNTSSLTYSQLSSQESSKVRRHDLLYEVAKSQKEKKHQKAYEAKKAEEEKELAECTFQPRTHLNPDTSPTKPLYEPKGYKKAIERLQVAEKLREERKAEKEHIPRGENYEKVRSAEFKPPSFLNRPKIKKQEALVYVDVNIGPGKTGRIGIHKGDDAKVLARNFAKTYSLPGIMKESLEKLLQSYIDSYFPEESQRELEQPQVQVEGLEAEEGEEEEGEEEEEEGEEEEGEEEEEEEEDEAQEGN